MSVPTPILQYNLSDASVKGLLPSGYTPLAYVECSNASGLINTGITSNNDLKFESKWGNLTSNGYLYGDLNIISSYASTKGTYNWIWGGLIPSSPKPIIDLGVNYVELSKNGVKINGVLLSTYPGTPSFSGASSIYIFGHTTDSTYYLTGRCYYFKIWDNETLVRDFIPCINSSNVVGLYDLVGRLFYSPSSNVLIAGPELAVGKGGGKSLPEEYLLVEYLESEDNVNCYINTGFAPNNNTRLTTSIYPTSARTDAHFWFGSRNGSSASQAFVLYQSGVATGSLNAAWNTSGNVGISLSGQKWYNIDFNKNILQVNGTTAHTFTAGTFTGTYPIFLFAMNTSGSMDGLKGGQRIQNTKIYDNGTIVRNMIPCYRKSDMKSGMYDTVNGVFYTNAGSGEFILGPSITNCYTSESNAGSETLQGLYTNISGVYDQSKGWVADFNGNTSKLISLSNPSFVLPLSVSCWINFSVINSNFLYAISYNRSNGGTSDHLFGIGINSSNKLAFWSCGAAALIDDSISTNTWYHVTLTINSSKQATFYLNGVLKYQGTPGSSSITATDFWIGCRCAGEHWFDGMLSNVQIWNTVLTAAQVKELYGK